MAFKAGEVVVDIHGNVIPLKRDMLKAEKIVRRSTTKMSGSMEKVGKSAALMGKAMLGALGGVAVGIAAVMAGKAIMRVGADFERSMATVRGVTRATDKQFEAMTATAKRLGETTEFTASQAASGLKFLGMAGFSAEKAIAALPGVLDLATAGGLELGRAADITSNALTAMQLEVGELGRVNDVFIATITRSNTNMEMMADSFRYAAPKARAYGYSIEQLSGMIGALGNAGIQGSMAGTQLSFAISRVDKVAKKLGMGSGATLIDVLRGMNDAGWSAAQVMDAFGERGGRAALVLKGIIPDVERLTAANYAAEGEAKKLAATMRDTVSGAFLELKSAIEGVAIDAFTDKQSILADQIRDLTATVRDNKDAWVLLATSLLSVTGFFISLAAAAGRAMKSVAGGGTNLYKRFKALEEVGFMRVEEWQTQAAEGVKVLEAFIAEAERRMKEFKNNIDWSDTLIPKDLKLTDLWATQTGLTPKFKVGIVPTVEQPKKLSKFDQRIEDLKSPGAAAQWEEEKWIKEIEGMNEVTEALKEKERLEEELAARAVMQHVKLAEEKLNKATEISNAEIAIEKAAAKEIEDAKRQSVENISELMSDRGADAFMAMIDGTKSVTEAFADMAKSILHDLTRMIIKQLLFNALMKAGESVFGLGGAKEGAAFSGGSGFSMAPFAAGGVVNSPTMFKYGSGVGVMGEAGPEAILPLTKTSKGLGVVAAMPVNDNGGNGKQMTLMVENININAVDSLSFQELTERNPDAILQPIKTALTEGDIGLQSLLKE